MKLKNLFALAGIIVIAFMLVGCNSDEHEEVIPEFKTPAFQMFLGETFNAEISAVIDRAGTGSHMGGINFAVGTRNDDDGWSLDIEWRTAENFFGNPPDNWEDATAQERNEYFVDYLVERNDLEPNHEIEDVTVSIFWPADGAYEASYTETSGKMVQFYRHDIHHTNIVIGFYSLHMQYDDEGAFFIEFANHASSDEERFNANQLILENFLESIRLYRFYQ